jgi:ribosome-binding factor A
LSARPGILPCIHRWIVPRACARFLFSREIMKRKRASQKQLESLCGQLHPDDGVDPSEFFRPSRKREAAHRKVQQLCQQVAETLSLVLGEEFDELRIVSVSPAPDTSQLAVLVAPAVAGSPVDPTAIMSRLSAAAGRLRAEVASAITRRRAPKLLFHFVALPAGGEEET